MLPFVICLVVSECKGTGGERIINSETIGVFGALTPDCCPGWEAWAGGHWDENGACCRSGGGLLGVSSWTGNANMATVGEWKGLEVQAAGSAGGRLSVRSGSGWVGGVLVGRRDCTNILSHYPDPFITALSVQRGLSGPIIPASASPVCSC